MGAVSPVSFVNPEFMEKVKNQVLIPTVKGLYKDNIDYKGFIFFGLMKVQGDPYVIEYNCRLGDPETEVILPRVKSDLLHLFEGIATDTLSECDLEFDERTATTVILASGGYPDAYEKGKELPHRKTQIQSCFMRERNYKMVKFQTAWWTCNGL